MSSAPDALAIGSCAQLAASVADARDRLLWDLRERRFVSLLCGRENRDLWVAAGSGCTINMGTWCGLMEAAKELVRLMFFVRSGAERYAPWVDEPEFLPTGQQ